MFVGQVLLAKLDTFVPECVKPGLQKRRGLLFKIIDLASSWTYWVLNGQL
jgi:hypothetical protein